MWCHQVPICSTCTSKRMLFSQWQMIYLGLHYKHGNMAVFCAAGKYKSFKESCTYRPPSGAIRVGYSRRSSSWERINIKCIDDVTRVDSPGFAIRVDNVFPELYIHSTFIKNADYAGVLQLRSRVWWFSCAIGWSCADMIDSMSKCSKSSLKLFSGLLWMSKALNLKLISPFFHGHCYISTSGIKSSTFLQ